METVPPSAWRTPVYGDGEIAGPGFTPAGSMIASIGLASALIA